MSAVSSSSPVQPLRESRERVPVDSILTPYISINPDRMHGEPVFTGTRVPIKYLFDHLRAGETIEDFLSGFPPVTRKQCVAVIDFSSHGLLDGLRLL